MRKFNVKQLLTVPTVLVTLLSVGAGAAGAKRVHHARPVRTHRVVRVRRSHRRAPRRYRVRRMKRVAVRGALRNRTHYNARKASKRQKVNVKSVYDNFRLHGFGKKQAAVMTSLAYHISYANRTISLTGGKTGSTAGGLFGLTPSAVKEERAWAKSAHLSPNSDQAQTEFIIMARPQLRALKHAKGSYQALTHRAITYIYGYAMSYTWPHTNSVAQGAQQIADTF